MLVASDGVVCGGNNPAKVRNFSILMPHRGLVIMSATFSSVDT